MKVAPMLAMSAVLLLLGGCPTAATHEPGAPARDAAKPTYPGPPQPWATMEHQAKAQYMKDVVLPTMKRVFQAHDPLNYKDFGCDTCHGLDPRERNFAMPNEDLFALYPTGHPEQQKLVTERRPTLVFMFNTVLPTMRQLLGQEAFDPETRAGFSCFNCHPHGVASRAADPGPLRTTGLE